MSRVPVLIFFWCGSWREPFRDWPLQKFVDLNTITTNEQRPLHLKRRREGSRTGMRLRRRARVSTKIQILVEREGAASRIATRVGAHDPAGAAQGRAGGTAHRPLSATASVPDG